MEHDPQHEPIPSKRTWWSILTACFDMWAAVEFARSCFLKRHVTIGEWEIDPFFIQSAYGFATLLGFGVLFSLNIRWIKRLIMKFRPRASFKGETGEIIDKIHYLESSISTFHPERKLGIKPVEASMKILSARLRRYGINTPSKGTDDPRRYIEVWHDFLSDLAPLAREGDLRAPRDLCKSDSA